MNFFYSLKEPVKLPEGFSISFPYDWKTLNNFSFEELDSFLSKEDKYIYIQQLLDEKLNQITDCKSFLNKIFEFLAKKPKLKEEEKFFLQKLLNFTDSYEETEFRSLSQQSLRVNNIAFSYHLCLLASDPQLKSELLQDTLDAAALLGNLEYAKTLIKLGASVEVLSLLGKSPLAQSLLSRNKDIFIGIGEFLIEQFGHAYFKNLVRGSVTDSKYTLLHTAAVYGKKEIVLYLLQHGADVSAKTDDGATALDLAIVYRHEQIALELFDQEAPFGKYEGDSFMLMFLLCQNQMQEIGLRVLNKYKNVGFSVDQEDELGSTLLHIAAFCQCDRLACAIFDELYESGKLERVLSLKIAPRDETVYFLAIRGKCFELIKRIISFSLEQSMPLQQRNSLGESSFCLACRIIDERIILALLESHDQCTTLSEIKDEHLFNSIALLMKEKKFGLVSEILKRFDMSFIDYLQEQNKFLFHHVAAFGTKEHVEILLEKGCSITSLDHFENSILFASCINDSEDVLDLVCSIMLKEDIFFDHENAQGQSALDRACYDGKLNCARKIIELYSNMGENFLKTRLCHKGTNSYTAIGRAARNDYPELFSYLLEVYDTHNLISQIHETLTLCVLGNSENVFDAVLALFLERRYPLGKIEAVFPDSPLVCALHQKNWSMASKLLTFQSVVEEFSHTQMLKNCLQYLAEVAPFELLKCVMDIYISYGYSIDTVDINGDTPLTIACRRQNLEKVILLLEALSGSQEHFGTYLKCLHISSRSGNLKLVQLFSQILSHIDHDWPSLQMNGSTALYKAIDKDRIAVAAFLIEQQRRSGLSLDLPCSLSFLTPLQFACIKDKSELVKQLLSCGANCQSTYEFPLAFISGNQTIQSCIKMTPLHFAAYCGHVTVIRELLFHNVDIEAKDAKGFTPLHRAAKRANTQSYIYLVQKLANQDASNNRGTSVFTTLLKKDRYACLAIMPHYSLEDVQRLYNFYSSNPRIQERICDALINPHHFQIGMNLSQIPKVAKLMPLELLSKYFNGFTFSDLQSENYVDPSVFVDDDKILSETESSHFLNVFISNIKMRKTIIGVPKADATGKNVEIFYARLENIISHILNRITLEEDTVKKKKWQIDTISRFSVAGAHCADRYVGEAIKLYHEICIGKPYTFEEMIYSALSELRENCLQMCIKSSNVHEYTTYLKLIGKIIGVRASEVADFDDVFASTISEEKAMQGFLEEYTFNRILEWMQHLLLQVDVRDAYIEWAKEHLLESMSFVQHTQARLDFEKYLIDGTLSPSEIFDKIDTDHGIFCNSFGLESIPKENLVAELKKRFQAGLDDSANELLLKSILESVPLPGPTEEEMAKGTTEFLRVKRPAVIEMLRRLNVFVPSSSFLILQERKPMPELVPDDV